MCFSVENNFTECALHSPILENSHCSECNKLKKMVEDFQTHHHTFTCEKKNKRVTIKSSEGHGRNDGKAQGKRIAEVVNCRFNFPQFPIHKTSFILGIPKSLSDEDKKKRKSDLKKIKNFLIRITVENDSNEDRKRYEQFKNWSFLEFLYEVGMFEKLKDRIDSYSHEEKKIALNRYLDALSASVRGSGKVFLKRNTTDIFTNNFNRRLLAVHKANLDIQIVIDQV